jgi:hypothetical protein
MFATLIMCGSSAGAQTGPNYPTPSWDQTFACTTGSVAGCPRFVVLTNFNYQAVLDRETGLVWQRQPQNLDFTLPDAKSTCVQANTGGRSGWRLPTIDELTSLLDETNGIPAGHPFINLYVWVPVINPGTMYWSTTMDTSYPSPAAFAVGFGHGQSIVTPNPLTNATHLFEWCVRGGRNSSEN